MRRRDPYSVFGWLAGLAGGVLICVGGVTLVTRLLLALHLGAPWWDAVTWREGALVSAGLATCWAGQLLIRSARLR
ncbi:MAG: hypothetical protein KGJ66_13590 [Alphaproteobacteria bacterium]|nr:hypothetical protein [Alphaproteobacteria bacterium]